MKVRSRPDAISQLMIELIAVLPKATKNFARAVAAEPADRPSLQAKVHRAEQLADEQLAVFITKVGDTFITPFDREDLLSIAESFDDALDSLDYTVDLLVRFEIESLPPEFFESAELLHQMAEQTVAAAAIIKKPKKFRRHWDEISELENRIDELHAVIVADCLSGKHEVFRALQCKEIADQLEHTANLIDWFVFSIAATAIKET